MACDPGVGSVMIVVVEPGLVGISAFALAGVGPGVSPFRCQGLVESFDLAIGLGSVWLGPLVLNTLTECLGKAAER